MQDERPRFTRDMVREQDAVIVNQMIRRVGDPDFGFPSDGSVVAGERFAVGKCGHNDQAGTRCGKKCGQFILALLIDKTV